jgi:small subunit ribosomal protein S20
MAHTKQQRKRNRQTVKVTTSKGQQRSALRTTVKKAEATIASGDKAGIVAAFKAAMSALAKGARKSVVSKGMAKRKTSRLAAKIAKASKTA